MDVTFTNVLEGARQYFQGLPAATGSSAGPAYLTGEQHIHNTTNQGNDRTSSTVPYWPPHQESQQIRTPIRDRTTPTEHIQQRPPSLHGDIQQKPPSSHHGEMQRPPSHHGEMQRPPSHHAEMQRPASHHVEIQRPPSSHHTEMQRPPSHHTEMQRPSSHHAEIQRPPSHHAEMQRPPSHHPEMQRPPSHHAEMQRPPSHHAEIQRTPSLHGEMQRTTSLHGEMQRVPSHHAEIQRPPSHQSDQLQRSSSQNMSQEQTRVSNNYQSGYSDVSNGQFQFTRPHSREVPVSQQYSSHILPNPTYHQQYTPTQQPSTPQSQQPQQQRVVRQEQLTNPGPSYHQLQPVQNSTQLSQITQHHSQAYTQHTQSRSYYQMTAPAKPATHVNNYKVNSTQSYAMPNENSYKTSYPAQQPQSNSINQNVYVNQKVSTSNTISEAKLNNVSNQNVAYSQGHRTTHNLPPIAALSVNYHSNRNNRTLPNQRTRHPVVPASSTSTTQMNQSSQQHHQYLMQNNHQDYRNNAQLPHANKPVVGNNYYNQAATTTITTTTTYTHPVASSSGTMNTVHQPTYNQSSSMANYQVVQKVAPQESRPQQQPMQLQNHMQTSSTNPNQFPALKQKRESPLDLSVKTVRTSADSTLDDTDEAQRMAKYYSNNRTIIQSSTSSQPYPTYDMYANAIQRNLTPRSQVQSVGAPKVDFNPNFNVPSMKQPPTKNYKCDMRRNVAPQDYPRVAYSAPQSNNTPQRHPNGSMQTSVHNNNAYQVTQPRLPRIDFPPPDHGGHKSPAMYPVIPQEIGKKRPAEPTTAMIPTKVPKVDNWKQTIDQQIEQRLSSYVKSKIEQDQKQQTVTKQLVNGNYPHINQNKPKENYSATTYHRPQYQQYPSNTPNQYSTHSNQANHNQTYVPSAAVHQYPGYPTSYSTPQQQAYPHAQYQQQRTNANPTNAVTNQNRTNIGGAADKRVLSLLRNSLEIKGAKEAQRKLEQDQINLQNVRSDVQQPSTDVTAPFQPKSAIVGRHNVSPFTAVGVMDRNSNTPPAYKFHFPKAMDSVKIETELTKNSITRTEKRENLTVPGNTNADLDGLAAFIAARIRTKAELKQVGNLSNNNTNHTSSSNEDLRLNPEYCMQMTNNGTINSTLKTNKDRALYSPRRKLFNRMDEEILPLPMGVIKTASLPPREKSGLRSSSETSVFDFPDSDSETEMPVLERQSLEDMRRDRKSNFKILLNDNEIKREPGEEGSPSPFDNMFNEACDNFMEQLKKGAGKKRGRRKKECDSIFNEILRRPDDIKKEVVDNDTDNVNENLAAVTIVKQEDSDSDTPLITTNKLETNEEEIPEIMVEDVKKEIEDSSASSDEEQTHNPEKSNDDKMKSQIKTESEDNKTTLLSLPINLWPKPGKKPTFGDGTEFYPGWEEALYKYKRSLRMPASLIHVTRPPNCQRLSTSLPDLDPCPISPAPSSIPDSTTEYNAKLRSKLKNEVLDSDVESNCSFNFSFSKPNYDSEGSSSVKSLNVNQQQQPPQPKPKEQSILDKLLERYGPKKRRKNKKKDEASGPKIIPKAEHEIELLPTPNLEVKTMAKTAIVNNDSVLLGFRKKTMENFKGAFIKNNKGVAVTDKFTAVVIKSRTRKETRVLQQKATIREVFGEDRPASAPPVTCVDDLKQKEAELDMQSQQIKQEENTTIKTTKQALKSKLINKGKKQNNLLKNLTTKKIKIELPDDKDIDVKSETASLDGEDLVHGKKRAKLRNIRRKFSSGFDYIRKKKKQVKKENMECENLTKPKRRGLVPKAMPESVQDIQREIKTWVLNKGIGETHLHRSARLGYTDVTAYCLEKMNCSPSPKDNAGYTPLHEACSRGHLSIARLLLMYGANVSASAQGGIRPLHEAAENGFVEIVRLLLSYGADPALATYSGLTPLSLAVDEATVSLLQNHLGDVQGQPTVAWQFVGPASCFEIDDTGYNPLDDTPKSDPVIENDDLDFEVTEVLLPNLYALQDENPNDRWILLQDLSNILKIKSRDTLLKQINTPLTNNKNIIKEMKMSEFLEQAQCCQFLNTGEKINIRASKIALIKYTDKVKQLLNVEKVVITSR